MQHSELLLWAFIEFFSTFNGLAFDAIIDSYSEWCASDIKLCECHLKAIYSVIDKFEKNNSPLTTNLTGCEVNASWAAKSLAVTWHSQNPSSNSSAASRIHIEQSPECDCIPIEVETPPAHSYFLGYIPTGLLSFCHEHVPLLSMTLQMSNASCFGLTSVYFGCSENLCKASAAVGRENWKFISFLLHEVCSISQLFWFF